MSNPPKLAQRCYSNTLEVKRFLFISNERQSNEYKSKIPCEKDRKKFENQIRAWLSTCVTSRTINPQTGKPYEREDEIISKEKIDHLWSEIIIKKDSEAKKLNWGRFKKDDGDYFRAKVYPIYKWKFLGQNANPQWGIEEVNLSVYPKGEKPKIKQKPLPPPTLTDKIESDVDSITLDFLLKLKERKDKRKQDYETGRSLFQKILKQIVYKIKKEVPFSVKNPDLKSVFKDPPTSLNSVIIKFGFNAFKDAVREGEESGVFKQRKFLIGAFALGYCDGIHNATTGKKYDLYNKALNRIIKGNKSQDTRKLYEYYNFGKKRLYGITKTEAYQIMLYLNSSGKGNSKFGTDLKSVDEEIFPEREGKYKYIVAYTIESVNEELNKKLTKPAKEGQE